MPPKKKKEPELRRAVPQNAYIENAGVVIQQPITETIEKNYMPYAMSVIVSRAIPEIDGFKPAHRKILYTMYKMGLLTGARTKSANVVGQTMRLNPHGDQAIYATLVRLAKGNEALLHPYVDSKGNFGKAYSRDMAFAASRYTEVKLTALCQELFADIDKDTVDFIDNYDNTMKEPTLLPVTFPSVLVNSNVGIAVGMASQICPFNLAEVCETAIALMKNPDHVISDTLRAPDFPLGGELVYDAAEMNKIYETGTGGFRVRSVYRYDKENNCVEITQIPPSTTVEAIIDKIVEMVKGGKVRELADVRDETDLNGLKITLDLKRGIDPDKLMKRLFKMTPLEDRFACNFNVLVGAMPKVLGVRELLNEWTAFREGCVRRRVYFDLKKKKEKLHLLLGLKKILLDIDKAVRIVRETEEEREVVPNLMIGFGIDEIQAEYVAEIRLRHLNREYILKRTEEVDSLTGEIAEMEETLKDVKKVRAIIVSELQAVIKKYGQPRKTAIIFPDEEEETAETEETPDYPVNLFFTKEGYFKKITPQSYRMSSDHKLKEGDEISQAVEATNAAHLLFFTDRGQVYKARAADFEDTKASVLGDYIPAKLGMDEGENAIYMAATRAYQGYMLFAFENGKVAKVELSSYETKTKRRKLTGAYSTKNPLAAIQMLEEDRQVLLSSNGGRILIVDTALLSAKSVRDTIGVAVMSLKGAAKLAGLRLYEEGMLRNAHRYRPRTLPSAGFLPKAEDVAEQTSLLD